MANLLATAGVTCGVGDGRQEKGKLSHGMFRPTGEDDPDFQRIVKIGWERQQAAMLTPGFYDDDAEELFSWHQKAARERVAEQAAPRRAA